MAWQATKKMVAIRQKEDDTRKSYQSVEEKIRIRVLTALIRKLDDFIPTYMYVALRILVLLSLVKSIIKSKHYD